MKALEAIPTKIFRAEGYRGTFSVDRKPCEFIGGRIGYQATWSTSGANWQQKRAFGETREAAFNNLINQDGFTEVAGK